MAKLGEWVTTRMLVRFENGYTGEILKGQGRVWWWDLFIPAKHRKGASLVEGHSYTLAAAQRAVLKAHKEATE